MMEGQQDKPPIGDPDDDGDRAANSLINKTITLREIRENSIPVKVTYRSKQWDYISALKSSVMIDEKPCNLVCSICLAMGIAVGAYHKKCRPANFFDHHHKLRHPTEYANALSCNSHTN